MSQLCLNIVGHNSAGKTFVAKKLEDEFGISRINGDDLRLFVYKNIRYFSDEKLGKKSPRNDQFNNILIDYRLAMSKAVLAGGQSAIIDGSGATKDIRRHYFTAIAQAFPEVRKVIIYATTDEPTLLSRMAERDKSAKEDIWVNHYRSVHKDTFEPPTADEADDVLTYDQSNYEEIRDKIAELLKD